MKIIQKLKTLIILSSVLFGLIGTPALALDSGGALTCGVNAASGVNDCTAKPTTSIDVTIKKVINLLSAIIGVVAVIMIMLAGFRYITSGGSPEGTKSARTTLTYAIIGLVIVAAAQLIARFVLNSAT